MNVSYLKVEILSPVHIGSGDQVDPFSYLITGQESDAQCHFIDPGKWAADHPDPEELARLFSGSNIAEMRSYMAEHIEPDVYAERSCSVVSSKILASYHKHLDKPESNNQLLLAPNLIGGSGGPLLPGSSIKGAIRTAVVDWLDQHYHLQLKQCRSVNEQNKKLEPYLGDITRNSFQALKIADCEAQINSSLIVEPREIRRNPEKDVTPKPSCEVLASTLLGKHETRFLTTKLLLGRPGEKAAVLSLKNNRTLNWQELCDLVNAGNSKRYQKEIQTFWTRPHFNKAKQHLTQIEGTILTPPSGSMVLKVGHYSQIEYVTIESNAPRTRKGKHGTTRTLADGQYPFGWILLTPCSEAEYLQLRKDMAIHNNQIKQSQIEQRRQRQEQATATRKQYLEKQQEQLRVKQLREERAKEEAAKPWLAAIRKLNQVDNWGDLKQQLERADLAEWNQEEGVSTAVCEAARRVYDMNTAKWDDSRSALINDWLKATGQQLSFEQQGSKAKTELPEDCAQIDQLQQFGEYLDSKVDLANLSTEALQLLTAKLKQWGCDKKKVQKKSPGKARVWQELQNFLKK